MDIFNICSTDGHIIFVVDISGIIRYRKISRIFLKFCIRKWVVTEVIDNAFYLAGRDDIHTSAGENKRIEEIEDHEYKQDFEAEHHVEDIIFLGIDLEMEFFDIKEKIVSKSQIFDDFMFFLVENGKPQARKEVFGFFRLGDEQCIQIFFLEQFFDLFSSPFVVEERMFRIDINIDSPSVRHFLYGFEYFV